MNNIIKIVQMAVLGVIGVVLLGACRDNAEEKEDITDKPINNRIANGIPCVEIYTDNACTISSKTDYVNAQIIIRINEDELLELKGRIRGRGNATWRDYPKKPYKIKLDESTEMLGFPANKDWVLLAEYCDKSLLRTAYMCEVSKAVGLEYTVRYKHIDLLMNGEYMGTYVLTEQVEKAKTRINIKKDGYIIEDDNYFNEEPIFLKTNTMGFTYTFKYPEAKEITTDDDNFRYLSAFFDNLEKSLQKIPQDCETYKKYIDIQSFAKWFVAAEMTGNWDPNLYYVLPSKEERLKMMPLCDAEWSLGLASQGNEEDPNGWFWPPSPLPSANVNIWNSRKYFVYLFKDYTFVDAVKEEWMRFKQHMPEVKSAISLKRSEIINSQKCNFERWPILNDHIAVGLVALGAWEAEVDYANSFFEQRVQWMDSFWGDNTVQ